MLIHIRKQKVRNVVTEIFRSFFDRRYNFHVDRSRKQTWSKIFKLIKEKSVFWRIVAQPLFFGRERVHLTAKFKLWFVTFPVTNWLTLFNNYKVPCWSVSCFFSESSCGWSLLSVTQLGIRVTGGGGGGGSIVWSRNKEW